MSPLVAPHSASLLRTLRAGLLVLLLTPALEAQQSPPPADLVLLNARVWTAEKGQPWAEAVAIRGERIVRVGTAAEVGQLIAPGHTTVLDLPGRLVLPGFIDNHTHFAQAGRLLLGLNLLDVNEPTAFRQRVMEAAERLPEGAWLVGGDWGAYAEWAKDSSGKPEAGAARGVEFLPSKDLLAGATDGRPALISRFDRQVYLANAEALAAAGITAGTPSPEGGEILRDAQGQPNGLLRGAAVSLVQRAIPAPSYAQRKAEALRALAEARRYGVTSLHDNVASFDQLQLFYDLRQSGELTARVWARMWLSEWEAVRSYIREKSIPAVRGGWGDDSIRLGGLKAWVDGIMGNSSALFFEPYSNDAKNSGRLRDVMFPEGSLYSLTKAADLAGFTVTVHAIGDKANRILLDTYERVFAENPVRDRRFRVVHAQVVDPHDFPRFGKLGLVAEVQPYHCIDDMRWMELRIAERARWSYAFRSLEQAGAVMSFGTDWPGTNASLYPIHPLLGLYAAVTRQTLQGEPAEGWFRGQRVSLEDALRYYTLNNAWITFEEDSKGSIREGKLADLVVLDRDLVAPAPALPAGQKVEGWNSRTYAAEANPKMLLETRVLYTILGGRIVYSSAP